MSRTIYGRTAAGKWLRLLTAVCLVAMMAVPQVPAVAEEPPTIQEATATAPASETAPPAESPAAGEAATDPGPAVPAEPAPASPEPVAEPSPEATPTAPVTETLAPEVRMPAAVVSTAPVAPSSGKVSLEGYRQGTGWTKGDLKDYCEGDWVPYRLIVDNSSNDATVTISALTVQLDANGGGYVFFYQIGHEKFDGNLASLPSGTGGTGSGISPTSLSGASAPYSASHITASYDGGLVTKPHSYGVLYFEGKLAVTPTFLSLYSLGGASYSSGSSGHVEVDMPGIGAKTVPNPTVTCVGETLTVLKTVDFDGDGTYHANETAPAGGTAHWKVVVTNPDPKVNAELLTLTDSNGHDFGPAFDLAAGQSKTFTYDTVPSEDTTNKAVLHVAGQYDVDSSASVHLLRPVLSVTKTVDFDGDGTFSHHETAELDSTAHWKVVVANSGDAAATGLLLADSNGHDFGPAFSLAAGTSQTFTYDTVPTADTTNTATLSYGDASWHDAASVTVLPHPPVLTLNKTVDFDDDGLYGKLESASIGATAHWKVVVANTGGSAASGLTLTDSNGHDFGPAFSVAAGQSLTFTYDTVPAGDLTDTATLLVPGKPSMASSAAVDVLFPDLAVDKLVDFNGDGVFSKSEAAVGGTVAHWKVTVSNNGEGDAAGVVLTDSNGHDFGGPIDLAGGEARVFTYDTVPTASGDNVALVSYGDLRLRSTATVEVIPPRLGLSIIKTVDYDGDGTFTAAEAALAGSTAHWRIVVANDGNVPALGATVTDTNGHAFAGPFVLLPGGSQTFNYDSVPATSLVNVATLHVPDQPDTSSSAAVTVLRPSLAIVKSVDYNGDGVFSATETAVLGSTAHWKVAVTNTGDGAALGVVLTDSNGHDFGGAFDLAAGATRTFEYDTVPLGDLANTVTASLPGTLPVTGLASVVVLTPAALSLDKLVDYNGDGTFSKDETAVAGATAHWRVTVSNSGEATAAGVALSDSNGHVFGGPFILAGGTSLTFEYDTVPTTDTTNTAAARIGDATPVTSSAHVTAVPAVAALSVDKTVDFDGDGVFSKSELFLAGSPAAWHIVVTNTGNVPVAGIAVADSLSGSLAASETLLPGQSKAFDYTTVVTVPTTNTVTVTATALEAPLTSEASAIPAAPFTPAELAIDKTVDFDGDGVYAKSEEGDAGDPASWKVVVSNPSSETVNGITVKDGDAVLASDLSLAPGESATYFLVTHPEVTTVNTATATSEATDPVSSSARAVVPGTPFLPFTGTGYGEPALLSLGLALLGVAFLLLSRRRRSTGARS